MRSSSKALPLDVRGSSAPKTLRAGADQLLVLVCALVVAQAVALGLEAASGKIPPVVFSLFRALLTL